MAQNPDGATLAGSESMNSCAPGSMASAGGALASAPPALAPAPAGNGHDADKISRAAEDVYPESGYQDVDANRELMDIEEELSRIEAGMLRI